MNISFIASWSTCFSSWIFAASASLLLLPLSLALVSSKGQTVQRFGKPNTLQRNTMGSSRTDPQNWVDVGRGANKNWQLSAWISTTQPQSAKICKMLPNNHENGRLSFHLPPIGYGVARALARELSCNRLAQVALELEPCEGQRHLPEPQRIQPPSPNSSSHSRLWLKKQKVPQNGFPWQVET